MFPTSKFLHNPRKNIFYPKVVKIIFAVKLESICRVIFLHKIVTSIFYREKIE